MSHRLAVGQMTSTEDIEANFSTCQALTKKASSQGASMLCLPENFAFLGSEDNKNLAVAQSLDGPLIARYRKLASDNSIWLSLGGFPEKADEERKIYNTHLVIDNSGAIKASYRKIHLFSLQLDGTNVDESQLTSSGNEIVVLPTPVGKAGASICYDLRFAELYLAMAKKGAELMLIPAAFTDTTGKAHWEILLRARAIENQCFVAAAAQTGRHNPNRRSYGHAMIVDPWGVILAQCSESTDLAIAEINLEYIKQVRETMPISEHRKPHLL